MIGNFDIAHPQIYFTSNFFKNHIFVGSWGEKKHAEHVFMRRDVFVSSVLCLTHWEFVQLAGEVYRRQAEYRSRPADHEFTTEREYDYWSRGGLQSKDKQRATPHNGRFVYKVRLVDDGILAMCHFHGAR